MPPALHAWMGHLLAIAQLAMALSFSTINSVCLYAQAAFSEILLITSVKPAI